MSSGPIDVKMGDRVVQVWVHGATRSMPQAGDVHRADAVLSVHVKPNVHAFASRTGWWVRESNSVQGRVLDGTTPAVAKRLSDGAHLDASVDVSPLTNLQRAMLVAEAM